MVQEEEDEEEEEEELSLGQETLVTARPGHAGEFSPGQLAQYTDDTLVIHDNPVREAWWCVTSDL